ncbi:MAG: class I tRNA ligase family protein, partial [Patescibacteria group bacterium]
ADKWILEELDKVTGIIHQAMDQYDFSYTSESLREFTWNTLADWYLEVAKIEGDKSEILNYLLNTILKLWHPFIPFVTEAIWKETYGKDKFLMIAKYPEGSEAKKSKDTESFGIIKEIITGIRSLRADYRIPPSQMLNVRISAGKHESLIKENDQIIIGLARLENLDIGKKGAGRGENEIGFVAGVDVYINVEGLVDFEKERKRLEGEIQESQKHLANLDSKLKNKGFVSNAPHDVIEGIKSSHEELSNKLEALKKQLNDL